VEVIKDRYSITELSGYLNVTDHTLRYYEREFNLYVQRTKGQEILHSGACQYYVQD